MHNVRKDQTCICKRSRNTASPSANGACAIRAMDYYVISQFKNKSGVFIMLTNVICMEICYI